MLMSRRLPLTSCCIDWQYWQHLLIYASLFQVLRHLTLVRRTRTTLALRVPQKLNGRIGRICQHQWTAYWSRHWAKPVAVNGVNQPEAYITFLIVIIIAAYERFNDPDVRSDCDNLQRLACHIDFLGPDDNKIARHETARHAAYMSRQHFAWAFIHGVRKLHWYIEVRKSKVKVTEPHTKHVARNAPFTVQEIDVQ